MVGAMPSPRKICITNRCVHFEGSSVRGEGRHGRIHMGVGRRARGTTLTENMHGMAHASVWCPRQTRLRAIRRAKKSREHQAAHQAQHDHIGTTTPHFVLNPIPLRYPRFRSFVGHPPQRRGRPWCRRRSPPLVSVPLGRRR